MNSNPSHYFLVIFKSFINDHMTVRRYRTDKHVVLQNLKAASLLDWQVNLVLHAIIALNLDGSSRLIVGIADGTHFDL